MTLVRKAALDRTPTVELRGLEVEGPVAVPPRVEEYFGTWPPRLTRDELTTKLLPLATRAFRRPLTEPEKDKLFNAVLAHGERTGRPEMAWHYAIRRILCSPAFLYRETEGNPMREQGAPLGQTLNQFTLASRLSYFLWSTMLTMNWSNSLKLAGSPSPACS